MLGGEIRTSEAVDALVEADVNCGLRVLSVAALPPTVEAEEKLGTRDNPLSTKVTTAN